MSAGQQQADLLEGLAHGGHPVVQAAFGQAVARAERGVGGVPRHEAVRVAVAGSSTPPGKTAAPLRRSPSRSARRSISTSRPRRRRAAAAATPPGGVGGGCVVRSCRTAAPRRHAGASRPRSAARKPASAAPRRCAGPGAARAAAGRHAAVEARRRRRLHHAVHVDKGAARLRMGVLRRLVEATAPARSRRRCLRARHTSRRACWRTAAAMASRISGHRRRSYWRFTKRGSRPSACESRQRTWAPAAPG
jgi:hypothetical protein